MGRERAERSKIRRREKLRCVLKVRAKYCGDAVGWLRVQEGSARLEALEANERRLCSESPAENRWKQQTDQEEGRAVKLEGENEYSRVTSLSL